MSNSSSTILDDDDIVLFIVLLNVIFCQGFPRRPGDIIEKFNLSFLSFLS